jgi:hypothetical protein
MLRVIAATALALFFTSAALADDWKEYENRDYSFTVHFPGDPTVETATYRAADGGSFPAHVFSVKQDTGVFKVTVVDMPGKQTGSNAAVMKEATKVVAAGGVIKFDIDHRVRAVYGRQLGIAGANGGYFYVALFYRNNRLFRPVQGRSRVNALNEGTREGKIIALQSLSNAQPIQSSSITMATATRQRGFEGELSRQSRPTRRIWAS